MPPAPDPNAHRRLGGLVLLLAAGAFAGTLLLPRIEFSRPRLHRFEVPLDRGVGSLEVGSDVMLAGLQVGRVTAADPARSADGRFDVVAVQIAVDPEIHLGDGTTAQLVAPILGTGTDVRLLPGDGPAISDGAVIPWMPPPGFLETVFGHRHAASLHRIGRDFDRLVEWYDDHSEEVGSTLRAIDEQLSRIEAMRKRDVAAWSGTWSRTEAGLESIERLAATARAQAKSLGEAWRRMVEAFQNSGKGLASAVPAGGGVIDELKLMSSTPRFEPIERRVFAIEAVWAVFRPGWADLVTHLDEVAGVARSRLPYVFANAMLASGEFTGLLDDVEADPLGVAGQAIGTLLGFIPSGDRRLAMARADALRDYVRAITELRETLAAVDRVDIVSNGVPAVPTALRHRLAEALAALADAEQAAVRAWAPSP